MKSAYNSKISELHEKLMSVPLASKVQHETSPRHDLNSLPTSNILFSDAVGSCPARAPHRDLNVSTLPPQTKVRVRMDPHLPCIIDVISYPYRKVPSTQNSPQLSSSMLSQSTVLQQPRRHPHSQSSDINPVVNNYRGLREDEFSVFESSE